MNEIRLLLVDDHPAMRAGIRALVAAEPDFVIVGETDNGRRAVELAEAHDVDVIVMDLGLAEMGGTEATRKILKAAPAQRVLVLSAQEDATFARMLFDMGAAGYALKRSTSEELVRAIRVVAAGGIYVDPLWANALAPQTSRRQAPRGLGAVPLSDRETEVIRLIARGFTSKEMAEQLGISPRTLETYRSRAMSKLDLHSRADLIRYAMRLGWLRGDG